MNLSGRNSDHAARIQRWIVIAVSTVMTIDFVLILREGQWLNAFLVMTLITVIVTPTIFSDRLPVRIPGEFLALALIFAFAALFLGEVRNYYQRIWWWDVALHASSGFLLGVLGFLLVYVFNENKRVDLHMHPRFVALFAFLFAVTAGACWEIFEFAMDRIFGLNMQKPMLGDPSGLTDTMWDLILDIVGAGAISVFGWWYEGRGTRSFVQRWIDAFISANPRLFR